ncbi:hypothetical protein DFH06DRAFT_1103302 [Mycena polygramma]|nr:hypothetical protein DFH06DRAFT_1103302 [Mycena polygramma]
MMQSGLATRHNQSTAPPSQPITPASQPIAPPSQPTAQPSTSPDATRPPLTAIDALRYLALVSSQTTPEVYNRFVDTMREFKDQTLSALGVLKRISQLFHDYPALIEGLNIFMPAGYSIAVSEDPLVAHTINVPAPMRFRVTHAKEYKKYVKKVKARYANNPKTYKTYKRFLEIMAAHQNGEIQDAQVYVQVEPLFKNAPDLLAELKTFVP